MIYRGTFEKEKSLQKITSFMVPAVHEGRLQAVEGYPS